ncbi:Phosphopantetheine adenylyltransferase [Bienertia sinuspersici]
MVDAKKGVVTEEDIYTLLQRYSASTVLALLREVSQFPDVKIDWKVLVKETKTGIKSAREYQMLWRHLAYRQPLVQNLGSEDQPLDDDSDLEYDLEACPPVSGETAMEAAKMCEGASSGSLDEFNIPNSSTADGAGLNVNLSNVSSENLHVQKQAQAAGTFDGVDVNGSMNNRKRKTMSEEEDLELITAVQKYVRGVGQLSLKEILRGIERWNIIRKKQGTLNVGGAKTAGRQLTEAQLATRHALDMAFKDKLSTGCGTVGSGTAGTNIAKSSASNIDLPAPRSTAQPSQPQPSAVTSITSVKTAPAASLPTSSQKKTVQPSVNVDFIQATAVAVGARIVNPSDADPLLKGVKAVQSNNAVHISGGDPLIKTSAAGNSTPLPPNVHFIRTGLTSKPTSRVSGTASLTGGQQPKSNAIRPPVPPAAVSQLPKSRTASTVAMEQIVPAQHLRDRTTALNEGSITKPVIRFPEDSASLPQFLPEAALEKFRATSSDPDVGPSKQAASAGNSQCARNTDFTEDVTEKGHKVDACNSASR